MSRSRSVSVSKRGRSAVRAPPSPSCCSTRRRAIGGASSVSPAATARTASHSRSGGGVLEEEAGRAGPQRAQHELVVVVAGDDEDARAGCPPRRSACVASMPSSTGIHRSIRTTSGWRSSASSTPSAPSPASPVTSRSGSASSSAFMPLRTSTWSSTRTILVRRRSCRGHRLDAADRQQRGAVVRVGVRVGDDRSAAARARRGRSARARASGSATVMPPRHPALERHAPAGRDLSLCSRSTMTSSAPSSTCSTTSSRCADMGGDLGPGGHARLDERVLALRRPPGHGHGELDHGEVHGRRCSRRAPATSSAPDPNI